MTLFDSRGLGSTVAVIELLAVLALVFAVIGYVERSSDAAFAEFMKANTLQGTELDQAPLVPTAQLEKGPSGCPVGKRTLPTEIRPLP